MTSLSSEQHSTDLKNAVRGVEVFVGGLPRSISEAKIQEVFSPCGEIVEIRMIKDQKGNMKGFCFVRFATKEAAVKAVTEKTGFMIDGKKIGVLPSSEQDTLYFGNLNKAWGTDDFEKIVLQLFPEVESIELAMLKDGQLDQKHRNRGFAFVKFSSHAAAACALRVGAQPDFRLGNSHPAVQWAEKDIETDPQELAEIKIAFVRNLPMDTDENYLKQLFEPCGKVEKVVVSKKSGSLPVGFIHFDERSDLERAIRELHEKTVRGPKGGQLHKLEVEVAKPMDRNKKRVREHSESKSSIQSHSKLLKEGSRAALSKIDNPSIQRELEFSDPYEDAVIALPLAVKERLLRILQLGIATRYDIDAKSLCKLKELPESIAISVLDQFMLSGAALHDKGAYLAGLISRQVDRFGSGQSLLPKVVDPTHNEAKRNIYSHQLSPPFVGYSSRRSDNYAQHYSSPPPLPEYPLPGRIGRMDDKGSDFLLPNRSVSGSQSTQIPRMGMLDERSHSPYGRIGLRPREQHPSPVLEPPPSAPAYYFTREGPSLCSELPAMVNHQAPRPQIKFDPFTGEPYKFDPFTGEPILPENTTTHRF